MAISEIEKLERRYAENPQGLTFAPLAEAYRKSGDPERALTILRPGLDLHPDYIPASIVLGRCQLDLGDEAAAEAAFGHVLGLDPENVIALKALADITERGGRLAESAERLRQLLDVDRSNDEAREQLARVEEAIANAPPPAPEEPPVVEAVSEEPAPEPATLDETSEPVAVEEPVPSAPSALSETSFFMVPPGAIATPTPTASLTEWAEPEIERVEETPLLAAHAEEPPAPWSPTDFTSLDAAADEIVPIEPDASLPPVTLDVTQLGSPEAADELELRSSGGHEFQLPSAAEEFAGGTLEVRGNAASEFQLPDASSEFTGGLDASASGGSEFQVPDAAESLLAAVPPTPVPEPAPEPEPVAQVAEPASVVVDDEMVPFAEAVPSIASVAETEPEQPTLETAAESVLEPFADTVPAIASVAESLPEEPSTETAATVAEAVEEAPAGEWVTWSDAALAEDAEPFPEEVPVAAEAQAAAESAVTPVEAPAAAVSAEAEPEPDLVVTESMAELFVRQGHAADALRVYRELGGRRPGDARIAARIAELEQQEAAARAPLAPYSARVTGGTSVRELMQTVLASRPHGVAKPATPLPAPAAPLGAPPEAAPTRPAADHLSLSDVFGEEGPPLPPAFRSSRPAADAGVSFDEFFGGEGAQASGEPARAVRAPRPGDDDLDQFHAWLQNLKK